MNKLAYIIITEKCCSKCELLKPIENFRKVPPIRYSRDGYHTQCKQCLYANTRRLIDSQPEVAAAKVKESKARNKERNQATAKIRYERQREQILAQMREHSLSHSTEIKERRKKSRQINKEKIAAQKKASDQRHKDKRYAAALVWRAKQDKGKLAAYSTKWRRENPEQRKAVSNNNRAKRKAAPGHCTKAQWIAKCEYWGWRCIYCRCEVTHKTLHMEHRKAISRGGSNWPANLAPCCAPCNLAKSKMTEAQYRAKRCK